ncbi:MAG TPA: glycosyltransferase [Isosphaeraceae bacterium]|jgi:glycosyltransferase involved in cell wall biosynthesis
MSAPSRPSVCFFARVRDRAVLRTTEFYAQDLAILGDLGFDVRVATRWGEIPWGCDLYYIWWWSWAFLPLIKARLGGRAAMITGVIDQMIYRAKPRWQRRILRANYAAADWNVVLSDGEFRWLREEFGGARSSYIPLGVDTALYAPGSGPREEFCLTVCWMKRSNAVRKSMFELIAAVPLILRERPGLRFRIAGGLEDGGPELQALARDLGVADAVEFLGRIGTAEKVRLMQTCQIYLQPTRFEGFGMAIAEAMSCGAPVVTSRAGAVPEVVGDCGEYVDGTDPRSIADGVLRLARDPQRRRTRALAARRRIEREFSVERRRGALAELLRDLLPMSRSPADLPVPSGSGPGEVHRG